VSFVVTICGAHNIKFGFVFLATLFFLSGGFQFFAVLAAYFLAIVFKILNFGFLKK